ncbi:TPA: protein YdfB, partial [Escherichia coli]
AYEEYFEGLAEGEEALSFNEFKQALSSSAKSNG